MKSIDERAGEGPIPDPEPRAPWRAALTAILFPGRRVRARREVSADPARHGAAEGAFTLSAAEVEADLSFGRA